MHRICTFFVAIVIALQKHRGKSPLIQQQPISPAASLICMVQCHAIQRSYTQRLPRITSEYLHVNTDRKLAQTDKAVTIHVRNSVSHAVGMWADIGAIIYFPSRVKEIHEAPR